MSDRYRKNRIQLIDKLDIGPNLEPIKAEIRAHETARRKAEIFHMISPRPLLTEDQVERLAKHRAGIE